MRTWLAALACLFLVPAGLRAEDYRVEPTKSAPPAGLAPDIASKLSGAGYKIVEGNRTIAEIWLAKNWTTKPDFQPSDTILYPLDSGSLVGALKFGRKGADFRGQEIAAGVYTLRYANQPVDGNHVGTFETRDFLLMVPASADQSAAPIPEMDVLKMSAEAAGSMHPAIMPLVKAEAGETPAMRHLEEHDWWTLRVAGQDAKGKKLALEVIVAGKAAE